MEFTPELTTQVTWRIPSALRLVGSRSKDHRNATTTSWITPVVQESLLIGVWFDKPAVTRSLITDRGSFTVNLGDAENTHPFMKLSKPAPFEGMTLNGWPVTEGETGAPVFDDA